MEILSKGTQKTKCMPYVHASAHGSGSGRWNQQIYHPEHSEGTSPPATLPDHSMACMAKSPLPSLVFTIHQSIEDPSGWDHESSLYLPPAIDVLCRRKTQLLD